MDNEPRTESAFTAYAYDPPKVEQVMGPDELAREVHYAGFAVVSDLDRT